MAVTRLIHKPACYAQNTLVMDFTNITEGICVPLYIQQHISHFAGFVESLRQQMIVESGGLDEYGALSNKQDVDTPTRLMLNEKHGEELERRIEALRHVLSNIKVLGLKPDAILNEISLSTTYNLADAKRKGKTSWTAYNFEKVPVVAAVTLLSKLKTDARSAELLVLDKLYKKVDGGTYKFDKLSAKWISPSTYVVAGNEPFQANIFMSATSSTQEVEVFVGQFKDDINLYNEAGKLVELTSEFPLKSGFKALEVKGGMANFEHLPQTAGQQLVQGVLKIKTPLGDDYNYFPFELNYRSAQADAVISPDKMNVLYIGVENPLSISAPGIAAENIKAGINQGRLRGSNGHFIAMVEQPGIAHVNVSAQMRDGSIKHMGNQQFRVKRIPSPKVRLGEYESGTIPTAQFKVYQHLNTILEDFVFAVQFEIVSYNVMNARNGQIILDEKIQGHRYNNKVKQVVRNARSGDIFYYDNVTVRGPDNKLRVLPTLTLRLI